MKAAVATGFGAIDENVVLKHDWPTPTLMDTPPVEAATKEPRRLLIRVLACALAPGDVRVLSGKTAIIQCPDGPPYVIGSDVSGIVVATTAEEKDNDKNNGSSSSSSSSSSDNNSRFQVGDYVIARFDEPKPCGGLAEYRVVLEQLTEHCPATIAPHIACGLPASAMAAKRVVTDFVGQGDRVLVIGGSGAVGSSMLQYIKLQNKASFVAAVSTQIELCQRLGADRVIDYRKENWWEIPEFHNENKFNVVIDLVNGDNWTVGAKTGKAIDSSRNGGTYVALLTGVQTEFEVRGQLDMIPLACSMMGRMLWSRLHPKLPKWVAPEALRLEEGVDLKALLQDVSSGQIVPLLDPSSPFPFTQEGVRQALHLQQSCHAHGKVVISISET